MKRICQLLLFLLLASCQSVDTQRPPAPLPKPTKPMGLGANVPYLPGAREEFVFATKPELLQHMGYDGFCTEKTYCDNQLPYSLYHGKRAYFEEPEPVLQLPEWDVFQVVLETGERYYYFTSRALGGRDSPVSHLVPLAQARTAEKLRYAPLIACSPIYVVESSVEFGTNRLKLSNGRKLSAHQLKQIRAIASRYGSRAPEVAELLLELQIEETGEGRWKVGPVGELIDNDMRFYLVLSQSDVQLRLLVKYMGEQWLYLRGLEFTADGRTWEAGRLQFERTERQGRMQEWVDLAATAADILLARELANAQKAVVRLEGRTYYDQLVLTPLQKEDLLRMLQLYERLRFIPPQPPQAAASC